MPEITQTAGLSHAELIALLEAALVDAAAVRAEVVKLVADVTALDAGLDTLVTKMNSDGGITDTDYAGAAAMTASAPAALTVTT